MVENPGWKKETACSCRYPGKITPSVITVLCTVSVIFTDFCSDLEWCFDLYMYIIIQAVWRGRQVRMKNKSKKLEAVRKRVVEAHRSATEDKKLGNRTESALDYLLKYKQLSQILEALVHLGTFTFVIKSKLSVTLSAPNASTVCSSSTWTFQYFETKM